MHDRPSKSARKRDALGLQVLGERLTELSDDLRARIPMSQTLRQALDDYRRLGSREARRRQLQYIGRLMRDEDPAPISAGLDEIDRASAAGRHAHSEAERWRERLLASDHALTEYVAAHPATDRVALRHLVRDARQRPEQAARALFRFIRADQQANETDDGDDAGLTS